MANGVKQMETTTVNDELMKFAKEREIPDERLMKYAMYLGGMYGTSYLVFLAEHCPDQLRRIIERDYDFGNKVLIQHLEDKLENMRRDRENEQTAEKETS